MRARHARTLAGRFLGLLHDPWGRYAAVAWFLYGWAFAATCALRRSPSWWATDCLIASALIAATAWCSSRRELARLRAEPGRMKDER